MVGPGYLRQLELTTDVRESLPQGPINNAQREPIQPFVSDIEQVWVLTIPDALGRRPRRNRSPRYWS